MKVKKLFEISAGHRLSNYDGKCKHLHGHNYIGALVVESDKLNELGMVVDFTDLKKMIKWQIEDVFDHKMVLKKGDPFNEAIAKVCEQFKDNSIVWVDYNPTVENLIADMQKRLQECLKDQYKVTIRLSETSTSSAEI